MKASWIKRIYKTNEGWATTPLFYGLNKIYMYGDIFLQKKSKIKNVFCRDVVQSVKLVTINAPIISIENLLAMPLWYNSKIDEEKISSWVDKGITTISNIIDTNGDLFTLEHIQNIMLLKCDFLLYNDFKKEYKWRWVIIIYHKVTM